MGVARGALQRVRPQSVVVLDGRFDGFATGADGDARTDLFVSIHAGARSGVSDDEIPTDDVTQMLTHGLCAAVLGQTVLRHGHSRAVLLQLRLARECGAVYVPARERSALRRRLSAELGLADVPHFSLVKGEAVVGDSVRQTVSRSYLYI